MELYLQTLKIKQHIKLKIRIISMNYLEIFSPGSIANVSCGFDVLGLCLDSIGDKMIFKKSKIKGIKITKISSLELPLDIKKNVAGVAASALYSKQNVDFGIEIEINKNIHPGSGIGSSAASAAGAVFGVNKLLGNPYTPIELVTFAMEGEKISSNVKHADNVASVLLGGCILIQSYLPKLNIIKIPVPNNLYAIILHPHIEIKTSDSRKILKKKVLLTDVIKQTANIASLISGMYSSDYKLISNSLKDYIIEPIRSILIPKFIELITLAKKNGGLGGGISGSGPSIFILSNGIKIAKKIELKWQEFYTKIDLDFDIYISKINNNGVKILKNH